MHGVHWLPPRGRSALAALTLAFVASCGGGSGGSGGEAAPPAEPAGPPAVAAPPDTPVLGWALSMGMRPDTLGPLIVSAIDPADGVPRPLHMYDSASLGGVFHNPVTDPLGRFVIIPIQPAGQDVVIPTAFTIAANGELTRGATSDPAIDVGRMAILPSGRFAYAATDDGRVRGYTVSSAGQLQELAGSPFGPSARTGFFTMVPHPDGQVLFLNRQVGPLKGIDQYRPVAAFRIDASTGALQPVVRNPAPAEGESPGNEAGSIQLAGTTHAWVLRQDGSWLLHAVDGVTGQLAPVTPAVQVGSWSDSLHTNAAGTVVVVGRAGSSPAQLQAYRLDAARSSLTAVGPALAGPPLPFFAPLVGDFLISGDAVLRLDPELGLQVTGMAPVNSVSAVQPPAGTGTTGGAVYALDAAVGRLRVLRVNASDGSLSEQTSTAVVGQPVDLAALVSRRLLAVVSADGSGPGTLSLFRIEAGDGSLAPLGTVATGAQPTAVAGPEDVEVLYVSHAGGIDAFTVDPVTGLVQRHAGSPFPVGYGPVPTHPDGSRGSATPVTDRLAADLATGGYTLFVAANKGSTGEISTLGMQSDGSLAGAHTGAGSCRPNFGPPTGDTFSDSGAGTIALAQAGPGRFVYALNRDANTIAGYRVTGGFCWRSTEPWMPPISGSPFATGSTPVAFARDPQARFLFVAHAGGGGSVSAFEIDPFSGSLRTAGSAVALGRVPARIWTDSTGRFLYTADAAGSVAVQAVDRTTGQPGAPRATLAGLRAHVAAPALYAVR